MTTETKNKRKLSRSRAWELVDDSTSRQLYMYGKLHRLSPSANAIVIASRSEAAFCHQVYASIFSIALHVRTHAQTRAQAHAGKYICIYIYIHAYIYFARVSSYRVDRIDPMNRRGVCNMLITEAGRMR